jgi:hypothetical protein
MPHRKEYQKARANNATELELDSINQRKDVEMASSMTTIRKSLK